MKDNYTHLVMVVDRSGSMGPLWGETVEGIKGYVEEQMKVAGYATMTLKVFDDRHDTVFDFQDIIGLNGKEIKEFGPRGMTALYDAIGKAINETGTKLANMDEKDRPSKVLFLIVTDGLENASQKFKAPDIAKMIKHQEDKYSWEFTYLGANQDAVLEGSSMGMRGGTVNYAATPQGTAAAYKMAARSHHLHRLSSKKLDKGYALGLKLGDPQDVSASTVLDDADFEAMVEAVKTGSTGTA